MSNQVKEKDTKQNMTNIIIELSDNKEQLYDKKNIDENIKEQYEDKEDENSYVKIFSNSPILNEEDFKNLTFSEKIKKKISTKMNLFLLVLNIAGILFYNSSLVTCESDATICTLKEGLFFYVKVGIFTLLSSIGFSIYASITLYFNKYFIHYLYTIPPYLYFIINHTGTDTREHGLYNSMGDDSLLISVEIK